MIKLIQRGLLTAFVFFAFGVSVASAQSINLSNDPAYATQFSHYCPPYGESFIDGETYSPTDRSCIYSIPTNVRALGYNIAMELYHGTPGSSTLLRREFVFDGSFFPTLVQVQNAINFSAFQTGDDFFGVVFSAGPLVNSQFPDLNQFDEHFSTNGTTTPNETYHLIQWKLGEFDFDAPIVTITSPTEGASYAQNATVPFTATINDASPIKFTQYYFNNSPVDPSLPLPLSSAPLGPASVIVVSSDIFDNVAVVTVNFTITDTPPPPPPFTFGGFLQPINNTGHEITENTSVFKAGSTVPVKFKLLNANGGSVQSPSVVPWIVPVQGPALSTPVSEAVYSEQPSSGNSYDWKGDHYQYNWKTSKSQSGYWYYLFVLPGDGNVYFTIVGLR